MSLLFAGAPEGPMYTLPLMRVNFPARKISLLFELALAIYTADGVSIYSPAVAGIEKGVFVDMVKLPVRIYLNVPFCKVSQSSVRISRLPPTFTVSVVVWELPLF